jgi:uncharacterized membrane protein
MPGDFSLEVILLVVIAPIAVLALLSLLRQSALRARIDELECWRQTLELSTRTAERSMDGAPGAAPVAPFATDAHLRAAPIARPSAAISVRSATVLSSTQARPLDVGRDPMPPEPEPSASNGTSFEQLLGGKFLLWVGAFALFLGIVFLFNFGVAGAAISPQIRMALAAIIGCAIYGVSWRLDRAHLTTIPDMLAAVAVSALIAVVMGCRYYYHWFSFDTTFALLIAANALLLIRGWYVKTLFSYFGIVLGYLVPIMAQWPPADLSTVAGYTAVFTAAICLIGLQKNRPEFLHMASIFQAIWSLALLMFEPSSARGYLVVAWTFLAAIASAWIAYERHPSVNEHLRLRCIRALVICAGSAVAIFGFERGYGPQFWELSATYMIGVTLVNRARPYDSILLGVEIGAFAYGLAIGMMYQSVYNLYMAWLLLLCDVLSKPSMRSGAADYGRYAVLLPIGAASALICRAHVYPAGSLNTFLTEPVYLLCAQACCVTIAVVKTIRAFLAADNSTFNVASSVLCANVGLTCATLLPSYWWTAGLSVTALLIVAMSELMPSESRVHFDQVFAMTVSIIGIGEWLGVRDLVGSLRGHPMLICAPLVWMGLPTLALWAVDRRFARTIAYSPAADRAATTLMLLGLSGVFWQAHTLLAAWLDPGSETSGAYHAGALLCTVLTYLWISNRARKNDSRSIYNVTVFVLIVAATIGALAMGLLAYNPWFYAVAVGKAPFFNALWVIYGIPWILIVLSSRRLPDMGLGSLGAGVRTCALFVGLLLTVSLVRQAFHGSIFNDAPSTTIEQAWISTSMAVYGILLLWAGIARRSRILRLSSLVILLLASCKVFLFDLATVQGVYRFATVFGLGAALMTIGYIYQKTQLGGHLRKA